MLTFVVPRASRVFSPACCGSGGRGGYKMEAHIYAESYKILHN